MTTTRVFLAVGTPEPTGDLCDRCLLPSMMRARLLGVSIRGVTFVRWLTACVECDLDV